MAKHGWVMFSARIAQLMYMHGACSVSQAASVCFVHLILSVQIFVQTLQNPINMFGLIPNTMLYKRAFEVDACAVHINCGGDDLTMKDDNRNFIFEGDAAVGGGVATYFRRSDSYWGFSSTGDFMDDNDFQNVRYAKSIPRSNLSALYATARVSPISLTYFAYCLENGNYTINLHCAEIQFTNDKTYNSLGRRFFDIYIQDELVQKNFNIKNAAHGAQKPLVKEFISSVKNNILEIRFHWAGRGTTRIPSRGVYGPLVSAISIYPSFKHCSSGRKKSTVYIALGVISFSIILLTSFILWWKCCLKGRIKRKDLGDLQLQAGGYTLKQIKAATQNFNSVNKIGEGGFGPVYKGLLLDGTVIAVKQLSSKSKQGNREFLNEIAMISCLHHPNLVKLHGFCVEGDQLLLIYEYMENNSVARALFGPERSQQSHVFLEWQTRVKICLGIARGLAFLHEDSRLKIVHRDIKATNVLLDKDLNPKISDFGLARLGDDENSHISTRVAGTIGYMAPEYAIWGHLSYKVDVYSFGVVVLEIVSGKSNNNYVPIGDCFCLLDSACLLQQSGNFIELVDQRLGSSFDIEEAEKLVRVALLCTNASPSQRPTMSEVVNMLEGNMEVPDVDVGTYTNDLRFKSMREIQLERKQESLTGSLMSTTMPTDTITSSLSSPNID